MKKRIFALLLSLALTMGMLPGAALAAGPEPVVKAEFDPETVSMSADAAEDYVATLSLTFDSTQNLASYQFSMDWSELKDAVVSVYADKGHGFKGALTEPDDYGLGSGEFNYHDAKGQQANKAPFFTAEFTLDKDKLEPGMYEVEVLVEELSGFNDGVLTYYLKKDVDEPVAVTATLSVADPDGNVPTPEVMYLIEASIDPEGAVTVSGLPAKAKAGETVSFFLNVGDQYEVTGVKANGEAVARDSAGTYSFVMPAAAVRLDVSLEMKDLGHDISVDAVEHGAISMNGVTKAEAGQTVTVYVKADDGYAIDSVIVTPTTGGIVTVTDEGRKGGPDGAYDVYSFTMPDVPVRIGAMMNDLSVPDVENGRIVVYGKVKDSYGRPLGGAYVKLAYNNGGSLGTVAADAVTGADGAYQLAPVDAGFEYKLTASYDTKVESGKAVDPGFVVTAGSRDVKRSSEAQATGKGDAFRHEFSLTLYYDWEVHSDETTPHVERIYAGEDGKLLTADDFYEAQVGGKTVDVFAGRDGDLNMRDVKTVHYKWDVDGDGEDEKVFVSAGVQAGTDNDYYMADVDHDPATADVTVKVGPDRVPATSDDHYVADVNKDGIDETVYAGEDGHIATEDDWYYTNDVTTGTQTIVYAGVDKVAGTNDDYYMADADGDGEADKVLVGSGNQVGTADNYYVKDVNGDGTNEKVRPGTDKAFNTADDYYVAEVAGEPVDVFPGSTGDEADPYDFGLRDDHYAWVVNGRDVTVRVGDDRKAGTADDEYDYAIGVYGVEEDVTVTVVTGTGIPGTEGGWYTFDADGDGEDEKVFVGTDGIPGTSDDSYVKDVNGDGTEETVYAGEDGEFRSPDDRYAIDKPVATDAFAGADGKPGTADDWYEFNADKTDEAPEKVFVGADRLPNTVDDYYVKDVNGDGEDETVFAGVDMTFPTDDDYYEARLPGRDQADKVYAGDDGASGTEDDYYVADPDKDGSPNRVFVGPDRKPGTADDWYEHDVDGKQPAEKVVAGEDGIPGTADDTYEVVVDGKRVPDAVIHVGEDGIPGTEDDWYLTDANGDGTDETVHVGPDGIPGTDDDYYDVHDDEACNCEPCACAPENDACGCWTRVNAGDKDHGGDGAIGTPDDYYVEDVDGDGKDEVVYVGPDKTDHTGDDWYYADITFDANGGTVKGETVILTGDIDALPEATRSGYNFKGWTLEKDEGDALTLEQVKAIKTDTTVYASWSRRYYGGGGGSYSGPYDIKFETNGGNKLDDVTGVKSGTELGEVELPTPYRAGYSFVGWCTDKDLEKAADMDARVYKDTVLYAKWEEKVSPMLTYLTDEHVAFITGYDDGNVHADASMTRAQAAMVFYRLLNDDTLMNCQTKTHTFIDVPSGAWYETAVATLARIGIINGKPGNVFDPDATITRGEFAVMCARTAGLTSVKDSVFVDVPNSYWAADGINAVFAQGWVTGYDNGKFGPENAISRAEAVAVLNRSLNRTPKSVEGFGGMKYRTWPDLSEGHWAYRHIIESGTGHWFKMDDGSETWTGRTAEPAR